LTRKAHRGPGVPPRELEAEIARLRSDLYFTRRAIIDLAPARTQDLLNSYFQKCKTRADVRAWSSDLVKSLIALADARPAKEMGDYAGTMSRALCPVCGGSADNVFDVRGFAFPIDLQRHLAGSDSTRECEVIKAAKGLAIDYVTDLEGGTPGKDAP
jgi:hypothetical protein